MRKRVTTSGKTVDFEDQTFFDEMFAWAGQPDEADNEFLARMVEHEKCIAEGRGVKLTGMSKEERRKALWGDDE